MKIDFKRLAEVEKQYEKSHISIDTLNTMINTIIGFEEISYDLLPNNIKTCIETLIDLDILVDFLPKPTNQTNTVQLNS